MIWEADGTPVAIGDLGAGDTIATAINNRGEVSGGGSSPDGTNHIFLWSKAAGFQELGGFPGTVVTVAPCCNTLNDSGQIAGFGLLNGKVCAFLAVPCHSHNHRECCESHDK